MRDLTDNAVYQRLVGGRKVSFHRYAPWCKSMVICGPSVNPELPIWGKTAGFGSEGKRAKRDGAD